jgi:hypothetical protein
MRKLYISNGMNCIFHKLDINIVEIYIDDVVVKSKGYKEHLPGLRETLEHTRKHANPNKCAFGVSVGQFLGFLIHERGLLDVETRYSTMERLCLCLYFSCTKWRPYPLSVEYIMVCKDDVVKHMLSLCWFWKAESKWILALSEFDLTYQSAKAIKGQVMADLVT